MIDDLEIRQARPIDRAAIEALYPEVFPKEDLLPLIRDLTTSDANSFVGLLGDTIVGHVAFTPCGVSGIKEKVALLGPLAVSPPRQRQGLGSTIVQTGLRQLASIGTPLVFVLGDPAYYSRFGFEPETNVLPPYPLPEEWLGAWQSLSLSKNALPPSGTLIVPQAWRHEALWLP